MKLKCSTLPETSQISKQKRFKPSKYVNYMSIHTIEKYKQIKGEISSIKKNLDKVEEQKEQWFKKKEDLKKEIHENVQKIKEIKAERDKKNLRIEELKKERDKYNAEVKHLIKEIKKLNEEKTEIFKKYNIKVDPSKIQEKINQLEKRVEQEVNFEKEKKLMEEIKKLKKSYEESSEVIKIADSAAALDRQIRETRKIADDFHSRVLEIMDDTTYDIFIELSAKINNLKKEQEAAFQKFIDHKNEYSSFSRQLRDRLEEMQVLDKVFSKNDIMMRLKKEEETREIIMEKTKIAEEKMKLGKKLTTEDVLALQAGGTS